MVCLTRRFTRVAAGLLIALLAVRAVCPAQAAPDPDIDVRILSSRPDTVSGGDVLVQVTVLGHSSWTAQLDHHDVTRAFHAVEGSNGFRALLTGLKPKKHSLEIRINGAVKSKTEIINHPSVGPIFSGPHQQPFICQTAANGLGPALDANCNAKTVIQYYYKFTAPVQTSPQDAIVTALGIAPEDVSSGFKVYDPSGPLPADVAQTVTSDGRTVNYIVRREIGTVNRAVYVIQFLYQPGQPLPTPWTSSTPGWNRRLVYIFGGECGAGYHQGTLTGAVEAQSEPFLAQGYAVATSTFNVSGNACNDGVSAETLSMVKERFIEQYGPPVHTIGHGSSDGSDGSAQVYLIAQNYPGLLDGIVVENSVPDQLSDARMSALTDCPLLDTAFKASKQRWGEEQKTAVSGFATWRTCVAHRAEPTHLDPRACDSSLPKNMIYDPVSNPKGVRCDLYANESDVLGRNSRTGFANRTLDNTGIQYGLVAFNNGKLDAEQFVALNEQIGGYDDDGNIVAARTKADPAAVRLAYQRGLILTGGGGLSDIPIIDWRSYSDDLAGTHVLFESFATRARLMAANGNADNQALLVDSRPDLFATLNPASDISPIAQRERGLVRQMDRWLDAIAADKTGEPLSAKVTRDKPADLADACWAIDGERIAEHATYDGPGKCNQMYPSHGDPRIAAGAPAADDVLKCALKPVSVKDYAQPLSDDQLERLRAVFPSGVCDYSRPGVGQQVIETTWQKYK